MVIERLKFWNQNPHQDVALGTPSIRAVPGEVYVNHFTSQCNTEVSFSLRINCNRQLAVKNIKKTRLLSSAGYFEKNLSV